MKIAEMTTAEQQLELLRMIVSCTWSNFAQQAEREKAQLKKAKPIATTKGGVKNFSSTPKLPQPNPLQTPQSQLSSPQTTNVARAVDVDADANYPPQQ